MKASSSRVVARYLFAAMASDVLTRFERELEGLVLDWAKKAAGDTAEFAHEGDGIRIVVHLNQGWPEAEPSEDDERDERDAVYDFDWQTEAPPGKKVAEGEQTGLDRENILYDFAGLRKILMPLREGIFKARKVAEALKQKKDKAGLTAIKKKMTDMLALLVKDLEKSTGRDWEAQSVSAKHGPNGPSASALVYGGHGRVELTLTQGPASATLSGEMFDEQGGESPYPSVTFKRVSVKDLAKPIQAKWNEGLNANSYLYYGYPDDDDTVYHALSEKDLGQYVRSITEAKLEDRFEDDVTEEIQSLRAEEAHAIETRYAAEVDRIEQATYKRDLELRKEEGSYDRFEALDLAKKEALTEAEETRYDELEALDARLRPEAEQTIKERHAEELAGAGGRTNRITFREAFKTEKALAVWLDVFRKHPDEILNEPVA